MEHVCQEFYSWSQKNFGKMYYCYSEVPGYSGYGANLLQNSQEWTIHDWILDQSCSKMLDFLLGVFEKMWSLIRNWGKWSDMVDVRLPEIISWEIYIIEKNIVNNRLWMGSKSSWLDNTR